MGEPTPCLGTLEEDYVKALNEVESEEESAVEKYTALSKDNEVVKAAKSQDIKYKTSEYKKLDGTAQEISGDKSSSEKELSAVNEYLTQVKGECVAQAESYESIKAKREAEISGLKEALEILSA